MTVAGRHAEESFGRIAVVVLLHGIKPRLSVFSVIWLNRAKIAAALEAGEGSQRPDINPVTLSIEAKLRRAGKGKRLVIANGAEAEVMEPDQCNGGCVTGGHVGRISTQTKTDKVR